MNLIKANENLYNLNQMIDLKKKKNNASRIIKINNLKLNIIKLNLTYSF
jgi:hypothetical protein